MIKKGGFASKTTKSGSQGYSVRKGPTKSNPGKKSFAAPFGEKKNRSDKPSYGEKRTFGASKSYSDKPSYGEKKSYGANKSYSDKPSYGEKKSYGANKSYSDKPSYGEKKSYGASKSYSDKPSYGEKKSYGASKSYSDKPSYGEKKSYGANKSYSDKPSYGEKRTYGASKSYSDKPSYGEKKTYGANKSYSDKPSYGEKKSYGANKSYSDKPSYGEKKPFGAKRAYAEQRTYSKRPSAERGYDDGRTNYYDDYLSDEAFTREAEQAGYATIIGRNAVKEAIKNAQNITRLYVADYKEDHALYEIVKKAEKDNIFTTVTDKRKLDKLANNENHQGIVAMASPIEFLDMPGLLEKVSEAGEEPFFVLLNNLTDPHNVGAIIRSAHMLKANGIIIGKRRSALIGPGVYKASAGSVEYVNIAQVTNLNSAIAELKDSGVTIIGCDMDGEPYRSADYSGPVCLVVGSEGEGLSQLVKKNCDKIVKIPTYGKIDSLNASVAAGIILAEIANAKN